MTHIELLNSFNFNLSNALSLSKQKELNQNEVNYVFMLLGRCDLLSRMLEKEFQEKDLRSSYITQHNEIVNTIS